MLLETKYRLNCTLTSELLWEQMKFAHYFVEKKFILKNVTVRPFQNFNIAVFPLVTIIFAATAEKDNHKIKQLSE